MRRDPTPYYDDEGLMEIVDYSTPRRGEDLSNPNVTRSTAIVADTPRSQVIEQRIFINERKENILLAAGEFVEVLNLVEAGEIVSIEVVSDNPYTSVYLEMDDYKNQEPNGVTAAELLARGRDEYSEREFYAEDRQKDGSYVIKYHPRKSDKYTDKLRLLVRNDLRPGDLFGDTFGAQEFVMRSNLPTPQKLNFIAGGSISSTEFRTIARMDSELFANALIRHPDGYHVSAPNLAILKDPRIKTVPFNPYVGEAGKISITQILSDSTTNPYVVFGEPGDETQLPNGETPPDGASSTVVPWPGMYGANGGWSMSNQWVVIYGSTAEDITTPVSFGGGGAGTTADLPAASDLPRLVFRRGNTLYFPGRSANVKVYNHVTTNWEDFDPLNYAGVTHGAIAYQLTNGLNFKPPAIEITPTDELTAEGIGSIGYLTEARTKPHVFIREIIVRRVRNKYLNG